MTADSFKKEVLPMKNKLYRFAFRMLGDHEESQDTVQDTFLRLWAKRDRLGEYRSMEAFAMVITKNLCLDKLKSSRSKNLELKDQLEAAVTKTPYDTTEISDMKERVINIIDTLPEQQKMAIHLRDIEGLDYDEIAEIMSMSLNNVRVNLSRARKKVRDTIIKTQNYEFSNN
jgi:RNA polymerase sigma-70 factor (ECF subfamily)